MDDFVILLKTKNECKLLKRKIELFLKEHLNLELNAKSKFYPYKMGVNFCGYRIFTTHRLLRSNNKKKIKKNVKQWNYLYHNGSLNHSYAMQSLNSWLGHSSHCNSFYLQQKVLNNCDFLYTDKIAQNAELELINLIETNKTDTAF